MTTRIKENIIIKHRFIAKIILALTATLMVLTLGSTDIQAQQIEIIEGNTEDHKSVKYYNKALREIDATLIDKFLDLGGTVVLSNDFGTDSSVYNSKVVGYYTEDSGKPLIALLNKEWTINNKEYKRTVYHEFGHFLYHNCDVKYSGKNIFELERRKLADVFNYKDIYTHNIGTFTEYFAESYWLYRQEPEKLQKYCPLTYNYIKKQLKSL